MCKGDILNVVDFFTFLSFSIIKYLSNVDSAIVIWRWFAQRGGTRCQLAPLDICFSSQSSSLQFVLLRNMRKKSRECRSIQNKTNDIFLLKKDLTISNKVLFALLFIIAYLFILTFSHTQRDFCFYCLQLNLTAGTNELARIKGVLSFSLKKGGKLKYRGMK